MTEITPNLPSYVLEEAAIKQHGGPVAGVDEAGRGPWAGPVVAAAVILDERHISDGLNDSKKLTRARRERLFDRIMTYATTTIAVVDIAVIDERNILHASLDAMAQTIRALPHLPGSVLVDGPYVPQVDCPAVSVVGGDRKSLSIAAASIIAKVSRDRLMTQLAREWPPYGWEHNAGYGTAEHKEALMRFGVTPHHRRSFAPIRKILSLNA
ncbi:MAG: ribonuclease HII [Parvularculales bacterium]